MTFWICALAFAIWFLRGLWVATQRPRLAYRSHEVVKGKGMFITVDRQQLLPPWLSVRETWLVNRASATFWPTREGDGRVEKAEGYSWPTKMGERLNALQQTIEARDEQLKEMSK